jgi:DNA primase
VRYPPHILDEIRARLPASAVVGRRVQLKKAGREWRGLSPFNAEKTPSFYVNDQKQFYHCFSSSKHGDIFTFLM